MFDVPSCVSGKEWEHYLAIETYLHTGAQYDHLEMCDSRQGRYKDVVWYLNQLKNSWF